jgi:hypothetical protein
MKRTAICCVLVLFSVEISLGWGNEGHVAINRAAANALPSSMPAFLKNSVDRLAYLGPEPDRWHDRAEPHLKAAQDPDHFINLELVGWLNPLPSDRYQFYRALYERPRARPHFDPLLPEKVGLQPYVVAEMYERLRVAFREYRHAVRDRRSTLNAEQNVVYYAGLLGHYVGDGANPLHTTINYNGWFHGPNPHNYTTSKDLHWKMEGIFVASNLNRISFQPAPARELRDPWSDYLRYLYGSNALVERVYQLEQQRGFDGEGTPQSREFIASRLATGAQMLGSLWYTAWVESAVDPPRSELFRMESPRGAR